MPQHELQHIALGSALKPIQTLILPNHECIQYMSVAKYTAYIPRKCLKSLFKYILSIGNMSHSLCPVLPFCISN